MFETGRKIIAFSKRAICQFSQKLRENSRTRFDDWRWNVVSRWRLTWRSKLLYYNDLSDRDRRDRTEWKSNTVGAIWLTILIDILLRTKNEVSRSRLSKVRTRRRRQTHTQIRRSALPQPHLQVVVTSHITHCVRAHVALYVRHAYRQVHAPRPWPRCVYYDSSLA